MSANILTQPTIIGGIIANELTVSRARRDDRGRTNWTVTTNGADLLTDAPVTRVATYLTNSDGEGLWVGPATVSSDAETLWIGDRQILGTCQFHASRRAILAFIRRSYGIEDAA